MEPSHDAVDVAVAVADAVAVLVAELVAAAVAVEEALEVAVAVAVAPGATHAEAPAGDVQPAGHAAHVEGSVALTADDAVPMGHDRHDGVCAAASAYLPGPHSTKNTGEIDVLVEPCGVRYVSAKPYAPAERAVLVVAAPPLTDPRLATVLVASAPRVREKLLTPTLAFQKTAMGEPGAIIVALRDTVTTAGGLTMLVARSAVATGAPPLTI